MTRSLETVHSVASSGNGGGSRTPFRKTRKSKSRDSSPYILRTRSAEGDKSATNNHHPQQQQPADLSTTVTSLHASFDATLLNTTDSFDSKQQTTAARVSMAPSWESDEERKRALPPSTVRKMTRRNSGTPARPPRRKQTATTPTPPTPFYKTPYLSTTTTTANTKSTHQTAATASLDSSLESPFGFSAFPASLPRVANYHATEGTSGEWKSPVPTHDCLPNTGRPQGAKLFLDDNDDDEEETALINPKSAGTRLNFGSPKPTAQFLLSKPSSSFSTASTTTSPTSPSEEQFRFRLDAAECSPILPKTDMELSEDHDRLSPVAEGQPQQKLSLSQESTSSSDSSSKQRRLRPMPDMSAFEAGGGSISSAAKKKKRNEVSTPPKKLLCPPTPVRTPAWAHATAVTAVQNPLGARTNSLIVTKVLATCPVEGHLSSSLETMEDDDEEESVATMLEDRRASLSFSTVEDDVPPTPATVMKKPFQELNRNATTTTAATRGNLFAPNLSSPPASQIQAPSKAFVSAAQQTPQQQHPPTESISFATTFENLGELGSGAFADVYKVRSKADNDQYYAVKRNRRQFRGKRDRDMALTEVRTMQKLQSDVRKTSPYLLFFYRAWQEEGYFYCQTELCCRDTCRELMESLRSKWPTAVKKYPSLTKHLEEGVEDAMETDDVAGRLVPDFTIWKICHDVAAGLRHIHSHGIVHHDIKPSNIFFVSHHRFGTLCKIGDFGMAGESDTAEDGQEGDTVYMPPELLSTSVKHASADVFSLGLTLYELASSIGWEIPVEGPGWHELRSGSHVPQLPSSRHADLTRLIRATIDPNRESRPTAESILNDYALTKAAGTRCDDFLKDYLEDVERHEQEESVLAPASDQTPRACEQRTLRTPTPGIPLAPLLYTPAADSKTT